MDVGYAGAVEKSALFDWSKDKDSQLSKYKKKKRDITTLFCDLFFTGGGGGLGSRICVGYTLNLYTNNSFKSVNPGLKRIN